MRMFNKILYFCIIISYFIYVKFLCDDNLGKLARYLRMMGYDTYFRSSISDAELLAVMFKQNRFVLTRDNNLVKSIELDRYLLIETDSPDEQLKSVIVQKKLQIDKSEYFSRCFECNEICIDVSGEDIINEVFPYLIKIHQSFKRCPVCRRIYWQGSHYKHMEDKLQTIINELDSFKH